jgi:hypothetical protein
LSIPHRVRLGNHGQSDPCRLCPSQRTGSLWSLRSPDRGKYVPYPETQKTPATGIAFGWIGSTSAFGGHVQRRSRHQVETDPRTASGLWLPDNAPSEGEQRPILRKRETHHVLLFGCRVRLRRVLGEAIGRDQTSVLGLQPAPPVRRYVLRILVTGGSPVRGGGGMPHQGHLGPGFCVADNGGRLVRKDAVHRL